MVCQMPGDDIRQSAYRNAIVARDAASAPRLSRHIPEQGNRSQTHPPELLNVRGPGDGVRPGANRRDVLVIAGQGSIETARKPEDSKRKGPLRVCDTIQHLPDTPLVRRVPVQRFFFRNRRQQWQGFFKLTLYSSDGIFSCDLVDVVK